RETLLADVRKRGDAAGFGKIEPLVFEGNVPSLIQNNALLAKAIDEKGWPDQMRSATAWLGDAIAIKDPTAAIFRPVGGNNLLIVGSQDESSLPVMSSAIISLGAQYHPDGVKFFVLDSTPDDDPNVGFLGRITAILPHSVRMVDRNDLGTTLGAAAEEVSSR